ncbi:MAG: hypothetical protein HZA77_00550 [Candidatus Schekmanbacteria bacterium]|nr:hypothetical protein [Candidatus Schekmanbacteria bacterium]
MEQPEEKTVQQSEDEGIDLLSYWKVIVKHRKLIRNLFLITVIFTAVYSLFMKNIYRAETTLMPLAPGGAQQALAAKLSENPLGDLLTGGGAQTGNLNKIFNVLKSRTVAESVINSLDLKKVFFESAWDSKNNKWIKKEPLMDTALRKLKGITAMSKEDRTGLITLAIEFPDAELSAKTANQYLLECQNVLRTKTFSIAKKNRIELEKKLEETQKSLNDAEQNFTKFQGKSKVVVPDAQLGTVIGALNVLKSSLVSKEMQLGVLKSYATDKNPDVIALNDEIREINKQIAMIESEQKPAGKQSDSSDIFTPISEFPDVGLNFLRLRRDLARYENIFALLTQQYELAKIEETKEIVDFIVIDSARVPELKYKPARTMMVFIAGMISILLGIFIAFFIEYINSIRNKKNN